LFYFFEHLKQNAATVGIKPFLIFTQVQAELQQVLKLLLDSTVEDDESTMGVNLTPGIHYRQ